MAKAKKLPSGNWRAQVYDYTDDYGKRHYRSFTAPSKKEAEYAAAEFALTKKQKDRPAEMTLAEAIAGYCDLKSNVLSQSTLREYRRMCGYSYDMIASLPLKSITPEIVQQWVNRYAADHSPKSVKNAHGLISAVLEAYAPGIQLHTTLPQKVPHKPYVPSDEDVKALLAYFTGQGDPDMELAVYLAAFGTLRRSEICALRAEDVIDNVITVNKAMVDAGGNDWVIKTTKTVSSTRAVTMPDFVIRKCPQSGQLVRLDPNQITRRIDRALKVLQLPHFRFHDLRHYAASIMHAIGIPDQYIMQRGGWSSDQVLKTIYRGTIDDYTQRYNDMALSYFGEMQHDLQHENE